MKRPRTHTRMLIDAPKVVVTPCRDNNGEIMVISPPEARQPVRAYWSGTQDVIHQSLDTLRATHLTTGVYHVHIVDARGYVSGATSATVESVNTPTVLSYRVRHASSDTHRDGAVSAVCAHVHVDKAVFLWTNGAKTKGPDLNGVPVGTYAALITEVDDKPVKCFHGCSPVEVDVEAAPS